MWTLGGIRIIATSEDSEQSQIISRLNPAGGGTAKHIFGDDDRIRRLACVIIGTEELDQIRSFTTSAYGINLSSYDGYEGAYLVKGVSWNRKPIYRQTVRTDLPEDSPVYFVNIELYEE